MFMGTFREKIGDSTEYKGEDRQGSGGDVDSKNSNQNEAVIGGEKLDKKDRDLIWGAKSYLSLPKADAQTVYNLSCLFLVWLWTVSAVYSDEVVSKGAKYLDLPIAWMNAFNAFISNKSFLGGILGGILGTGKSGLVGDFIAFVVSHGPVLIAMVLCIIVKDRLSWRWPFQKEKVFGGFGFFFFLGWLTCLYPVMRFVKLSMEAGLRV